MNVREKLVGLLAKYFDVGDSYYYNLTRTKNAFAYGTMGFDDFEEFDDETVADIAEYLIAHGVTVQEWDDCEYCKGEFIGQNPIVPLGNNCGIDSIVEGECLYNFCNCGTKSVVKINFCPMCGRRLQPPKGEPQCE